MMGTRALQSFSCNLSPLLLSNHHFILFNRYLCIWSCWLKTRSATAVKSYVTAIKRNEIESFVETWMDLETVIQSEVRKRKTNIVY